MWKIKTKNKTTWDMDLASFKLSSIKEDVGDDGTLRFEPQLPYIYVPNGMWATFTKEINGRYSSIYDNPVCNDNNACIFPEPCDKVKWDIYISFTV